MLRFKVLRKGAGFVLKPFLYEVHGTDCDSATVTSDCKMFFIPSVIDHIFQFPTKPAFTE